MKMKPFALKTLLISGVIFSGLLGSVSAGKAENLNQVVNEALANNPDLAAAKFRFEQISFKAPQVGSLKDPVLSLALSNRNLVAANPQDSNINTQPIVPTIKGETQ